MEEINLESDWQDDATLIDSIEQSCNEFSNFGCYLYRLADGREILHEDLCNRSNYYLLEEDHSREAKNYAINWADSFDSHDGADYRTEMISWGLADGDDYTVAADFDGECSIIMVGNYRRYTPVRILSSGEISGGGNDKNHIFPSREAAQEWIKEKDASYYPSYNEVGRPAYYIVAAE